MRRTSPGGILCAPLELIDLNWLVHCNFASASKAQPVQLKQVCAYQTILSRAINLIRGCLIPLEM